MAELITDLDDDPKESPPSVSDMQSLMKDKAHELFALCDTEQKGFITKRDMQRLQGELPLTPEQLENVFDSLDDDGNGYLTLEEFTDGFGSFLGVSFGVGEEETGMEDQVDTFIDEDEKPDPQEELINYKQMMNNIGATGLFDEEPAVKSLWCRLRREDPNMAENFEDFLYRISNDLKRTKSDFDTLENALKSKATSHDEEIRKLYEEMESQIRAEKEKVLAEEKAREKAMRDQMEKEIFEKDRQLQEMMAKQIELEEKIGHLNTVEAETKVENEKLMRVKEELEETLTQTQVNLEETKSYISQLRQQDKDDKRARAKAALQLSEGIAMERETLVKQLDMLKHMNRKLQDDKDEAETRWRKPVRMTRPRGRRENWQDRDQCSANISIQQEFQNILKSKSPSQKM